MWLRRMQRLGASLAMVLLAACGEVAVAGATIAQLEAQARELVKTAGCQKVDQCKAAPVGSKACGGPREYVVYCAATTNEAELLRKLEQLRRAEEKYNQEHGVMSDCMVVMPPPLALEGGQCRAASSP